MNLVKGLLLSAVGALLGAVVWVLLESVTGMRLWVLAPVVGGAAGYGMMRATQMKGGPVAGVVAAALTLAAVFGARYFIVTHEVQKLTAVSEEEALDHFTDAFALDMAGRGVTVHDEEGDYLPKILQRARDTWEVQTWEEHEQYLKALQEEKRAAAGALEPLALVLDFRIIGIICTALSVGTAFKLGSVALERALVERGLAVGGEDAAAVAAKMRGEDEAKRGRGRDKVKTEDLLARSSTAGQWSIPVPPVEDRPLPRIRVISSDDPPADPTKEQAA